MTRSVLTRIPTDSGWEYGIAETSLAELGSSRRREEWVTALGSEGLMGLALALSGRGFSLLDVVLRDGANRSSEDDSGLSRASAMLVDAVRREDHYLIAEFRSRIGRDFLVHEIALADDETALPVRVTRLGEIKVGPSREQGPAVRSRFVASLNRSAA